MEKKHKRGMQRDADNYRFYQMPKFLFEGDLKKLSINAKVLYSLLRDRHDLSLKNGWADDNGEAYVIYSRESMGDLLGCSQPTVRKAIKQLEEHGLIREKRQGLNKPNIIFIMPVGGKETTDGSETKYNWRERFLHSIEKGGFDLLSKNISGNDTESIETEIKETETIQPSASIGEPLAESREYIILPDDDPFLLAYKDCFRRFMGKEHMRVTEWQLDTILSNIEILESNDIDIDIFIEKVEEHFQALPKANNGNIIAFFTAMNRYFCIHPAGMY